MPGGGALAHRGRGADIHFVQPGEGGQPLGNACPRAA